MIKCDSTAYQRKAFEQSFSPGVLHLQLTNDFNSGRKSNEVIKQTLRTPLFTPRKEIFAGLRQEFSVELSLGHQWSQRLGKRSPGVGDYLSRMLRTRIALLQLPLKAGCQYNRVSLYASFTALSCLLLR